LESTRLLPAPMLVVKKMILALVYALCLVSVPLAGGRVTRLAEVSLRRAWLAGAAIAMQILIVSIFPALLDPVAQPLHLASYVLLGAFAWFNRHVAGVLIVALGGALNFLVISLNGGVMPADPGAVASIGRSVPKGEFINSTTLAHPKLAFLGDVIATPASWPVHNIYSVGDCVIVLGVLVLLHVACGSRIVPRRFRLSPPAAAVAAV
jgi:hypothetical protein